MSLGIYIHIPFCKSKCYYCDFNSYPDMSSYHNKYVNALCMEINDFKTTGQIDTIYIGGGTPTILSANNLNNFFNKIYDSFDVADNCEITVECNPGTVDTDYLTEIKKIGVNRLSLGLQSTSDTELKMLGRIHNFEDFKICFNSARKAGFDNISLDLIYSLPGQSVKAWLKTLEEAIAFDTEHISCYSLKIEDGTPFAKQNIILPEDDIVREMYDKGVELLSKKGYNRYEVSNFSKKGKESRHNLKYWNCDDFVGFGAGAYSCVNNTRYSDIKDIAEYCDLIFTGRNHIEDKYELSLTDRMSEFCFLGLRKTSGISINEFYNRFNIDIYQVYGEIIEKNINRGTMIIKDGYLIIPDEWLFVSNSILVDFV